MRKTIAGIFILSFFYGQTLLSNSRDFNNYIQDYKDIAIREMQRTGVPASIKLAQGLLESNAGKSTLAQKANNHFGIKCGGKWKGKTFYRKDDDYRNGKLVKSCFRKYRSAQESFVAHSNFLEDNRRYGFLFQLNGKDYKKWAKGLKKAGYATSKTYDKKLIKLIEEYHLYKFDHQLPTGGISPPIVRKQKEHIYINDVKMVYSKEGDTPTSIAKRFKVNPSRIVGYNEAITSAHEKLTANTSVFLQKKRRKFRGRSKYHTVKQGENMYLIAQQYGIRLSKLYKRNKMSPGSEPAIGEGIRLKGSVRKSPKLKSTTRGSSPSITYRKPTLTKPTSSAPRETTEEVATNKESTTNRTSTTTSPSTKPLDNSSKTYTNKPAANTVHLVKKGETLWRISQQYGVSVKDIMHKNNLQSTTIRSGATLRIN